MNHPDSRQWPAVIGVLAIVQAIAFLAIALSSIRTSRDIQYPESAIVYGVLQVQHHQPLYQDYRHEPFTIIAYTPGYYEFAGTLSRLTQSAPMTFLLSRALTLACSVAIALLVFTTSRRMASRRSSLIATAMFLGSGLLIPWGYSARVDTLALLFATAALSVLVNRKCSRVTLPALLLAGAFLTKQSCVALVPAAIFALARASSKGAALRFGLLWGGVVTFGAALGVLVVGPAFALNVFASAAVPARALAAADVAWRALPSIAAPLALALPLLLSALSAVRKDIRTEDPSALPFCVRLLLAGYLAASLLLAIGTSVRAGSDINYYIEPLIAACLCASIALDRLDTKRTRPRVQLALVAIALLCDAGVKISKGVHSEFLTPSNDRVVALVRNTPGEILAQDANVLLQARGKVSLTDSFHLAQLERSGKWDSSPLREKIRRKEYALIILSFEVGSRDRPSWSTYQGFEIWSPSVQEAVSSSYAHTGIVQGWHIYRPR